MKHWRLFGSCILILGIFSQSCAIEKRHYRNGFYFHTKHRVSSATKETVTEPVKTASIPAVAAFMADTVSFSALQADIQNQPTPCVSLHTTHAVIHPPVNVVTHVINPSLIQPDEKEPATEKKEKKTTPTTLLNVLLVATMVVAITAVILLLFSLSAGAGSIAVTAVRTLNAALFTALVGIISSALLLFINDAYDKNRTLQVVGFITLAICIGVGLVCLAGLILPEIF